MKLEKGMKVKVSFGNPSMGKFKRGIFTGWSKNGKDGFFWHKRSKKVLRRPIGDFQEDVKEVKSAD